MLSAYHHCLISLCHSSHVCSWFDHRLRSNLVMTPLLLCNVEEHWSLWFLPLLYRLLPERSIQRVFCPLSKHLNGIYVCLVKLSNQSCMYWRLMEVPSSHPYVALPISLNPATLLLSVMHSGLYPTIAHQISILQTSYILALCWFDSARKTNQALLLTPNSDKQACQDAKMQLAVDTNTCDRHTADERFYLSSLKTEVATSDGP
jgi:hypothetical protein